MNKTGSCEYRNLIVFDLFLITFFAVLLLAGSFMDERIAGALFTPDSTFVKFVTSTGVLPYFSFAVVFLAVLCKKIIDSGLNKKPRIIIGIFLIIAGIKLAERSDDGLLIKRVICLLALLVLSYALLQIFKGAFNRPRYRLVVRGYEGIGFIPWHKPFKGAAEYIERHGFDKGELRSFPSGHSIGIYGNTATDQQQLKRY